MRHSGYVGMESSLIHHADNVGFKAACDQLRSYLLEWFGIKARLAVLKGMKLTR
jgi:hypothetical protein